MKDLIKWEMIQTIKTKSFWGFEIIFILGTLLFMMATLFIEEGNTGYDIFLQNCNNLNSLMIMMIGIFAGIHVAGAFEERRAQAAIMAGNSRLGFLLSKFLSFSMSVAFYYISTLTICSIIGFFVTTDAGIKDMFFRTVILRVVIFAAVEVAITSICFLLSIWIKKLGGAITANLVCMLVLNFVGQTLIGQQWSANFMKYTSIGQTFYLLVDSSDKNLVTSAIVSVIQVVIILALSYFKFRKEELK